jgi:phosphomannomutase
MKEALKVGVSGVRGVVGDSFTPQVAVSLAQAFGTFVGRGAVVVGRDTRPSGAMIECAVVAGLQSVGCKPVLAGIVPTPTALILTRQLGARGGIAITASHNPSPWNALKFFERFCIQALLCLCSKSELHRSE